MSYTTLFRSNRKTMKRQESKTPQPSPGPETGIKGRLLIVDDETAIRWALRKTLQRMNFEIAEAETGEQAIALVRTVRFDAVLLDIAMPGMSGIEACRTLRKLMPLLGIVMLTVRNTEEDKRRVGKEWRSWSAPAP